MRVTLMAMLGKARIPLQVDIAAGDAVVPPPDTIDYPGLLDLPRARVRAYRPETSIDEKTVREFRQKYGNNLLAGHGNGNGYGNSSGAANRSRRDNSMSHR